MVCSVHGEQWPHDCKPSSRSWTAVALLCTPACQGPCMLSVVTAKSARSGWWHQVGPPPLPPGPQVWVLDLGVQPPRWRTVSISGLPASSTLKTDYPGDGISIMPSLRSMALVYEKVRAQPQPCRLWCPQQQVLPAWVMTARQCCCCHPMATPCHHVAIHDCQRLPRHCPAEIVAGAAATEASNVCGCSYAGRVGGAHEQHDFRWVAPS